MDDQERADARRAEAELDAGLVARALDDDPDAFGELYDRWFTRVHDLSFRITRDSSDAAEVAQDAFVAAWQGLGGLDDPRAFGGWLLRITRNTALNRRRKEQRSSPRDAEGMAVIEVARGHRADAPAGFRVEDRVTRADDPARAVEDSELSALVWEAADALGERDAEVLDLTLRHGLTPAEVGDVIGINRNAANQAVHKVRGRLRAAVEARVLWRSGEPVCGDLADALAAAGVTRFGADAVRVASTHADGCEQCSTRRSMRLEPSALFAATPLLALPLLKAEVAHALMDAGVPMGDAPARAVEEAEATGPSGGGAGGRGWRHRALVVGAGLVVVLAGVVALAEGLHEDTVERRASEVTTTSSTAPAVTSTLPVAVPEPVAPPTTAPPAVQPPPPPAPPVSGSLSIAPGASSGLTFPRPRLTWTTVNASSVTVSGPGISSASPTGVNVPVCPGNPVGPDCTAPIGSYTYVLRAFDANGVLALETARTFTVG